MVVELERNGHVLLLSLNRPEARNAVNGAVAEALEQAWMSTRVTANYAWRSLLGVAPYSRPGLILKR